MSKKKFTDGLESLFSFSVEENAKEEVILVVEGEEKKEEKTTDNEKKKREPKRRPSKSFAADLESLFASVPARPKKEEPVKKTTKSKDKEPSPKVFSGLEALLRNTVDPARFNQGEPTKMKRVTFTFDKEKLVRLKEIAKSQKAYLKDIIGKVVTEYIEEFEKDKEVLNEK